MSSQLCHDGRTITCHRRSSRNISAYQLNFYIEICLFMLLFITNALMYTILFYWIREKDNCIPPEPLVGIRKFHSIWINKHGELRGQVLSCDKCIVSQRCADCDLGQMTAEKEKEQFECNVCLRKFASKGGATRHKNSQHKK